jgi:sulfur carrier protein ThiS adenylyltransferase
MRLTVNERPADLPSGSTAGDARDRLKPGADVLIVNGAVVPPTHALREEDTVVLIRRGETPSAADLEALLVARHTPGVHAKVRRAAVGIAGLGGLGSAVAVALARTGVGRLVLADFDVVEPSNLNRQQYFVDQLGLLKTEALAANLRRINPHVTLAPHAVRLAPGNIPEIFRDVDVLVEAFDRADQKAMLLDTFVAAFPDRPLVMASGLAGHGPGGTIAVRRLGRTVHLVGDGTSAAEPGRGLMAPRVGIAAHLQANTVLRLLLGEETG